jgi:hypothetical protein
MQSHRTGSQRPDTHLQLLAHEPVADSLDDVVSRLVSSSISREKVHEVVGRNSQLLTGHPLPHRRVTVEASVVGQLLDGDARLLRFARLKVVNLS